MFKHLKKSLFIFIFACFITVSANAILPLVAGVIWLGEYLAVNASVAVAVEASVYIHAGAFVVYELFFAKKGADGKPTGDASMTIKLSPSAVRQNPDPTKYDSATAGQRDPTPKQNISPIAGSSAPVPDPNGNTVFWGTAIGKTVRGNDAATVLKAVAMVSDCLQTTCSYVSPTVWNDSPITITPATVGGLSCTTYAGGGFWSNGTANTWPRPSSVTGCPSLPSSAPVATFDVSTVGQNCPLGYAFDAPTSSCKLTDATAVKKPANWPCEILRTSTGLQVDKANPNCDGVNLAGNSVSPTTDTSVSFNADGSVSVANPNGQTTFQLGTPNSDGSVPITGATRSGNPSSYVPGSSSTSTSACGGVGQPACSGTGGSTVGGGTCGGAGQSSCSVTVSGFDGLGDPTASGRTALDNAANDRSNSLVNQTNKSSALNILSDWVPRPQISATCEPLVIPFMRATFTWDFCKYLPLLSQVMGYVFYIFAGMYIWKSFMNSNTPKGT